MWSIPEITEEFRQRMYDLLDLYQEPYKPQEPILCVDEKSKQLLANVRQPITAKPGKVSKQDYQYERRGVKNIFLAVEPKAGRRIAQVTKRRTKTDFAKFIKFLIKRKEYQKAKKIHLVIDNLNTHFKDSFFETFKEKQAKGILKRIQFHYTPAHGSWLNMAEIEISILERQCLGKRMKDETMLKKEVSAWQNRRNRAKKKIEWKFTKQDADRKLEKYYIR